MSVLFRPVLALTLCCSILLRGVQAQDLLPAVSFDTVASVQYEMLPADFNGDGMPDFASLSSTRFLQVWLGNGDGTFRSPLVSGARVRPAATGDVDGDGHTDVLGSLLWAETGRGDLVVVPGRGDGTFSAPVSISPSFGYPEFAVLADLDNDSRLDLLTGYGVGTGQVFIFPGSGGFSFAPPIGVYAGGEGPQGPLSPT